jgi:hypothetical protein
LGYIKNLVCVPPLPRTLVQLRESIDSAEMTIERMMLQNLWKELDYRLDVCSVTQGSHIEHLYNVKKLGEFTDLFIYQSYLYVQYFGTYRVLKTNESFIVVRYNKLNDA